MMNGDEARRFGEKLLAEVQVTDLNSVLKSLRLIHPSTTTTHSTYFSIPPLDTLLPPCPNPPILTLISPPATHQPSGSGKTSLVTLIIATALSTASPASTVILIDPLQHFSIPLLSRTLTRLFSSASSPPARTPACVKRLVKQALAHVHVVHPPPTYPALLSTLRSLPSYLLSPAATAAHASAHRTVHAVIVEDTDVFAHTMPPACTPAHLALHLARLASLLDCAVVTSGRSTSPNYFRPALPAGWPKGVREVRIALAKVEPQKLAAGPSVDEAEAEAEAERCELGAGRVACEGWRVASGSQQGGGKSFLITIDDHGVEMQEEKKKNQGNTV